MNSRVKLDDSSWASIFRFLKSQPDVRIGNPKQCRRFLEGVLWIARTGAQWRELPSRFGKWNTIYQRYRRWCQQGIWTRLLETAINEPDLENLIPDSTVIRAHPCAAGAKGGNNLNR